MDLDLTMAEQNTQTHDSKTATFIANNIGLCRFMSNPTPTDLLSEILLPMSIINEHTCPSQFLLFGRFFLFFVLGMRDVTER